MYVSGTGSAWIQPSDALIPDLQATDVVLPQAA